MKAFNSVDTLTNTRKNCRTATCAVACASACALFGGSNAFATAINTPAIKPEKGVITIASAASTTTPTVGAATAVTATAVTATNTNATTTQAAAAPATTSVVPAPALPTQEAHTTIPQQGVIPGSANLTEVTATTPVSMLPGNLGTTATSDAGTTTATYAGAPTPPNTTNTAQVNANNSTNTSTTASQPLNLGDSEPFQPWQAGTAITLFLAAIGLVGYSMVRVRSGKNTKTSRPEKPLEVISSMSIGPKRQLMIVRVRNQEIVIASTETGVTMLTDVAKETAQRPMLADMQPLTQLARASVATSQNFEANALKPSSTRYADSESVGSAPATPAASETSTARKSDLLSKALNNLKERKNAARDADSKETGTKNSSTPTPVPTPTPALSGNNAGFNKFFANAFEQEAKRTVQKTLTESEAETDDSVENVSKLIREKLKNIQATGH